MAFGVLFDFTGNSNVSKVIKAKDMVQEKWFLDAVNYPKPVDLFVVIGHNPVRTNASSSTFGILHSTIRKLRPDTPIQAFGGHAHVRDFVVYDDKATGLASGRYCETLGWLAMSGIKSSTCKSKPPKGVPNPTRKAIPPNSTATGTSDLRYARRYLDWNRLTFAYHAKGSQPYTSDFDTEKGKTITSEITTWRQKLNLTDLYGCAPETYCQYCKPFLAPGNIFTLLQKALSTIIVNPARKTIPRIIIVNTGSVRFDLPKGPFTYDDSFIVSPFKNKVQYIPSVPWSQASKILDILNAGPYQRKRRDLSSQDFNFSPLTGDQCVDPPYIHSNLEAREQQKPKLLRRQSTTPTPGYVTRDDFGTDGDDTVHSRIPNYPQPNDLQANGSFPTDGTLPEAVDVVFLDFIQSYIINALKEVGGNYGKSDVQLYMPDNFTSNMYLPEYAKVAWQANVPNCPIGQGIGFDERKKRGVVVNA